MSENVTHQRRLVVLSERIIKKYQNVSKWINSEMHPTNVDRIDDVFKFVTGCYAISSSSVEDYINHVEPSRLRKIKSWAYAFLLGIISFAFMFGVYITKVYENDSKEVELFLKIMGIPGSFVPNKHHVLMTLGILIFMTSTSRLLTLVLEQKHQIEALEIAFSIRYNADKFKLNSKYYSKVCIFVGVFANYIMKGFQIVIIFMTFVVLSLATLYSFVIPGLTFSYTMIVGCFFWTFIIWIAGSIYFCGFFAYFGSVIILMYRFKQVNQRIKYYRSNIKILMWAIHDHHQICSINERSNRLLSLILFEIYFGVSVVFDIAIVQVIYLDTILLVKLIYLAGFGGLFPSLYSLAYLSARLNKASRGSYANLNSIIAREMSNQWKRRFKNIGLHSKLKIINLIERMAQTEISVWCLDLFPLNGFEFYLFIAATARNLIILIDLIGK